MEVDNAIAVFQDVFIRADVSPAPANPPARYSWTVSPDGPSSAKISSAAFTIRSRVLLERDWRGGLSVVEAPPPASVSARYPLANVSICR